MITTPSIRCIAILALSLILSACQKPPNSQTEALNRMVELGKQGRYDQAVKVVQTWLADSRRNVAHDGLLHQQIALMYLGKAYREPSTKDNSMLKRNRIFKKNCGFSNCNKHRIVTISRSSYYKSVLRLQSLVI
jgi:hypothetical protein